MSPAVRAAIISLAAFALSGCVSLLPKSPPVQLYRFTAEPGPGAPVAPSRPVGVLRATSSFTQAAAGDRILTVAGGQTAYIAQSRWVAPAEALFDEALMRHFDASAGPARLVRRGETARTDLVLRLDVRNFEAVYDQGVGAAPLVVVRVRGALTRSADRTSLGEQIFERQVRAGDNRVTAIVAAYDRAVAEVLTDVVAWTNRLAPAAG